MIFAERAFGQLRLRQDSFDCCWSLCIFMGFYAALARLCGIVGWEESFGGMGLFVVGEEIVEIAHGMWLFKFMH